MDDRTFDQKTALDWIDTVEGENGEVRETDLYPHLNEWIRRTSPIEVLDIGCGQGICSDKIDLTGRNYTGVEPSPYLVARAKQLYRNGNRSFVIGNAYELPFPGMSFDSAFSVAVWHLLEKIETAASELSRVLKPDGHFLIITANPHDYTSWKCRYDEVEIDGRSLKGKTRLRDGAEGFDQLYLPGYEELVGSLRSKSLDVQKTEVIRSFISLQGQKRLVSA